MDGLTVNVDCELETFLKKLMNFQRSVFHNVVSNVPLFGCYKLMFPFHWFLSSHYARFLLK